MKTSTFSRSLVSILLVMALMLPTFATAQTTGPVDFLTKSKKNEQKSTRQGKKMTPKMLQMKKAVKTSQAIPSATNLSKALSHKSVSRTPLAITESGAALYGNLIFSNLMMDFTTTGYYSINPNTGEYQPVGTNEQLSGAGTVVDGIAYISYADQFLGMIFGLYTVVYDVENASIIEVVEHNPEDYGSYAVNMAYNYIDDVIYALTYTEDGYNYTLSQFDRENYTYTKIAELNLTSDIFAMTFDNNGTLYIICADGKIREMNPDNGEELDVICDSGFLPEYMQSACWSPKDNKILWAASNETESHILAIDLTTGTTEKLCTFNELEEWTSLYTTDPIASEDAPAAPVISQSFSVPGALTGTIVVEVPSVTLAGDMLTEGDLTLIVTLNDTELINAQATPGETKTFSDQQFREGINTIKAYAVNTAGKGVISSHKAFAGNDTPLPVTDLEVSINENGQATLVWTTPTGGKNGGYVNLSAITYTIERSGETVATGITSTTYTDQLPDEMAAYQWTVYAVFGDKTSQPASTEKILFGDALSLPYKHNFDNEASLDLYTIVDANGDEYTWEFDAYEPALLYTYSSAYDADDYAFTPPLQLTDESSILVEINACSYSLDYPEIIEVTLGTSTDPSEQTVIIPATQLNWVTPQTLRAYFTVAEPGSYHVGIHAVSYADMYYLVVKDIKVAKGPVFGAPKAVQDVTVTPGANGALTATLAFTAPTETFGGDVLTEDITVTAYRDDEVVGTTTIAPGATGTIIDNNAINGMNDYVLVTSNSSGDGDIYEISCLCGIDVPSYVTEVTFTTAEDNLTSVMSWKAPVTGANGGYLNPDELVYTIYTTTADGYDVEVIAETSELYYELKVEDKTLQPYTLYVTAKNDTGESDLYGGSVVLGAPYTLPFIENIEGTTLVNSPWMLNNEDPDSYATWELGGSFESYNLPEIVTAPDGGMAVCYDFYEVSGGKCGLLAPKVSLVGENAPTLYLSMYHYTIADDANTLSIEVTTDDATYKEIFAKKVNDASENGWAKYSVSLAEYKDAPWIGIMINANVSTDGYVFLDYVTVENAAENDVLVESFSAPKNAKVGEEIELSAKILNKGINTASYNVTFFIDDEEIESIADGLESNDENEYRTKFVPKAENIGESIIKVVVNMLDNADNVMENNEASSKITISQPHLRVVTDLEATENGGNVTLTWSEPTLTAGPIVDDMEDYESFIVENIGDYTIVDADNTETYGIEGADNMPLANGPKAWQVWAPTELGITTDTWQAHESEKCLIAFSTVTGAANDWLISPEVMGGTEFSFWAAIPTNMYGAETFEVLYSTTNTDINSFQLLSQETKNNTEWQEYVYALPNDAKYFAIRYTSVDIFALLIDDISYTDPNGSIELSIEGYNIYCDGQKINDNSVTETSYNHQISLNKESSYNVTVVYNEGESLFSNTVYVGTDGIVDINDLGVYVYGQKDYIKIENVSGRMLSVYTTDGKIVCNMKATDSNILIPANLGAYIVRIDNIATYKVIVR